MSDRKARNRSTCPMLPAEQPHGRKLRRHLRDCVSHVDLRDASMAMAQSPRSFEYFNEI